MALRAPRVMACREIGATRNPCASAFFIPSGPAPAAAARTCLKTVIQRESAAGGRPKNLTPGRRFFTRLRRVQNDTARATFEASPTARSGFPPRISPCPLSRHWKSVGGIIVASRTALDGLPEQRDQVVADADSIVASGTAFLESAAGSVGQTQGVIQFSEGQESSVGGNGSTARLQPDFRVELEPERELFAVTDRAPSE